METTRSSAQGAPPTKRWEALWARQEEGLEPLSRALAGALRHGQHANRGLPLAECRKLAPTENNAFVRASDVLLVAMCSTRRCGPCRFEIQHPNATQTETLIRAIPRIAGAATGGAEPRRAKAVWDHGPPPKRGDRSAEVHNNIEGFAMAALDR